MRASRRFRVAFISVLHGPVYNALNIYTTLTLTQSGPIFRRPVTIVPPRIAE